MKEKIVMLYSGGADSVLMLQMAVMAGRQPYCLLVNYEQKHSQELEYAKQQLSGKGISFGVVNVTNLGITSGLTGKMVESRWDNVHPMNVPARNSWLLSLAASVAEDRGCSEVWIGCDMSDFYNEFPDCKQEYIGKMNSVFQIALTKPIKVIAPLLGITKDIVLDMLKNAFGIDKKDIYSGYEEPQTERCVCREIYIEEDGKCEQV